MKIRKTQYWFAALLAGIFLLPTSSAGKEAPPAGQGPPSPSPAATPSPPPTPRPIHLTLYFRRPARIVPIYCPDRKVTIPRDDFEICDETPWLTEADVEGISYQSEDESQQLRLHLKPGGKRKFAEAMMGNVGRTVIVVLDNTVRSTAQMKPLTRKDRMDFSGDFSAEELKQLQEHIQFKPSPSPIPSPLPIATPRKRFIFK